MMMCGGIERDVGNDDNIRLHKLTCISNSWNDEDEQLEIDMWCDHPE